MTDMSDWTGERAVGEPVGDLTSPPPWPRATPNGELPNDVGRGTNAASIAAEQRRRREALEARQLAERANLLAAHNSELRDAGFEKEAEPVKTFAPVNINIGLDELMAYFGMEYDEDGPTGNPNKDIREQILAMAADKLVKQVMTGDADFKGRLNMAINEALGGVIEQALERQYQPLDWSGQPKGQPTTLIEIIGEQAQVFLAETMAEPGRHDSFDRYGHKGKLKKFVIEETGRQFEGELKTAADSAKATVIEAVKAKGAEFLGQAFADAAAKVQAVVPAVQAATTPSMTLGD